MHLVQTRRRRNSCWGRGGNYRIEGAAYGVGSDRPEIGPEPFVRFRNQLARANPTCLAFVRAQLRCREAFRKLSSEKSFQRLKIIELTQFAKQLRFLDRIDSQIGFDVPIKFNDFCGIARLFDDKVDQKCLDELGRRLGCGNARSESQLRSAR